MSARIILHPRTCTEAGAQVFAQYLADQGWDWQNLRIGPKQARGYCELLRFMKDEGGITTFERMDGSQFVRESTSTEPEVA